MRLTVYAPNRREVLSVAAIEFSDVAAALSCEQFARQELEMRGRRAKCPWCPNPEHYNLAFLPDGKAYCHKCHKGGDVVTLAAAVWHMSQREAAAELNTRFKLGLGAETVTAADLERRRAARQADRERREAERADFLADRIRQGNLRAGWRFAGPDKA